MHFLPFFKRGNAYLDGSYNLKYFRLCRSHMVLHVCHRFSGVTEEDLENTTISLRDVQAVLLSLFSAESILIGHSLESDLLALKVTPGQKKNLLLRLYCEGKYCRKSLLN